MVGYVLEKSDPWPEVGHDVADVRPEVPGIVFCFFASGDGEWLARISRSDDIHAATPRFAVESSNVRPDRRRIQGLICHARRKDAGGIGFPLDITNGVTVRQSEFESKLKSSGPRTEGQHCGGRTIHTETLVVKEAVCSILRGRG